MRDADEPPAVFRVGPDGRTAGVSLTHAWTACLRAGSLTEQLLASYLDSRSSAAQGVSLDLSGPVRPMPREAVASMGERINAVVAEAFALLEQANQNPIGGRNPTDPLVAADAETPGRHVRATVAGDGIVAFRVDETWAKAAPWEDIEAELLETVRCAEAGSMTGQMGALQARLRQLGAEYSQYQKG